ncbi:hypothetical protein GCM10012285_28310 [Streptomyces kronopolitis]|uniref:Uncharacterized protein n=1 Tax=Streptomyces kronopolitis TaxID=1612435 RepID=A0ABQ2JCX9_9ACTN|nr:hypothetical protein GCM10012285_28310 [Streptomyces kronopolitis]
MSADPAGQPQQLPFLLSSQQGEAARALLSYVASLGLPGPDSQLVAVVVAIRAARGGVDALRALGWQVDDALFDGDDPATPVPVTVPDLAREADHPLPFGKNVRSRVSGWTTRALSAKPVKKLPPAARLAGLFLAAHSTAKLQGQIPPDLPEACRAALPDLRRRGFLAELSEDRCRLDPAVRHLSGMRRPDEEEQAAEPAKAEGKGGLPARPEVRFDAAAWAEWKRAATPALRRHVETVEFCAVCALEPGQVASAFMERVRPQFFSKWIKNACGEWKEAHPDRGPQAAEFTVDFRAEHGHGPSYNQLCSVGWDVCRSVRGFIVQRLLSNEWLTDTSPVPWTLRPGQAAQALGIALPRARGSAVAPPARP